MCGVNNYKNIYKIDGEQVRYVFANLDKDIITPQELLQDITPLLDEMKKEGIATSLRGEQEQNEKMAEEMSIAFALSLFLIFFTLLIMFNSYKYSFVMLSIIPLSFLGALIGHLILGHKMSMPSFIGMVGLGGVVVNDAIVMLAFLRNSTTLKEVISRAKLRLRPIVITSITTFLGLSPLVFFATGQAKIVQPVAIALGFGMLWGLCSISFMSL